MVNLGDAGVIAEDMVNKETHSVCGMGTIHPALQGDGFDSLLEIQGGWVDARG